MFFFLGGGGHFFKTRFNKEFAVSGLGMVFNFQRFQLAFGSVVEQPIDFGSTWILGDCLGGGMDF